jgi:hypothetical protein
MACSIMALKTNHPCMHNEQIQEHPLTAFYGTLSQHSEVTQTNKNLTVVPPVPEYQSSQDKDHLFRFLFPRPS